MNNGMQTPDYQNYQGQQPYVTQNQTVPGQWPHMKLSDWLVTFLLMLIPIANIVLMFVWAFGSNVNPSKKAYFRAALIMAAIGVGLSILLSSVILTLFSTIANSIT